MSPGIDPELARVHFLPTSMTNEFFECVGDDLGPNSGDILGLGPLMRACSLASSLGPRCWNIDSDLTKFCVAK
jgi:hypothetical protein